MAENQVLSQAEIDALLGGRPGDMELVPEVPAEPEPEPDIAVNVVGGKSELPDYAPEDVKDAAAPPDRDALEGIEAIPNPQEAVAETPVQAPAEAQEPQPEAAPAAPPPVPVQPAPVAEAPQPEAVAAAPPVAPAPPEDTAPAAGPAEEVPEAPVPVAAASVPQAPGDLDAANQRIQSLELGLAEMTTTLETMQQGYQAMVQHLNSMNTYIQNIREEAQATPGHGLRKTFVCEHCAAQGAVAAKIQCTSCGDESWWGWWPAG